MSSGPVRPRVCWSWLAQPMLAAVAVAFWAGMLVVHDVASVLVRAGRLQRKVEHVQARLLAEDAAVATLGPEGCDNARMELGGATVVAQRDAGRVRLATRFADGRQHGFVADVLPGRAPLALGAAFTAAGDVDGVAADPNSVRRESAPALDAAALAVAVRAEHTAWVQKEPALALQHWAAGTDADDFVLLPRAWVDSAEFVHEMLVVPGNLWLEPGDQPCEIGLARDLVLVVQGNLYLGRSLQVRGPGRLVLAVAGLDGAPMFADVDGNGRWSAKDRLLRGPGGAWPLEGTGAAWIGLPGARGPIVCDAGVVVAGELHLATSARVRGPLALAHGLTRASAQVSLLATGEFTFWPERERVAGFRPAGRPRPGLLRDAAHEPDFFARLSASGNETLVVASPAR
ncbi:MAG: hypothetical protein JNK15_08165 [Planctomycetes bacterium]|nr:hypothetical protein [Planctomycetota bacterium]